jgi:hypothetical protein
VSFTWWEVGDAPAGLSCLVDSNVGLQQQAGSLTAAHSTWPTAHGAQHMAHSTQRGMAWRSM